MLYDREKKCFIEKIIDIFISIMLQLLNSISSRHDEDVFTKGKSEENRGKNRYSNIIPGAFTEK